MPWWIIFPVLSFRTVLVSVQLLAVAQRSRLPLRTLCRDSRLWFPIPEESLQQQSMIAIVVVLIDDLISTACQFSHQFWGKVVSIWSNHPVFSTSRHVVPELSRRCYLSTILSVAFWSLPLPHYVPLLVPTLASSSHYCARLWSMTAVHDCSSLP